MNRVIRARLRKGADAEAVRERVGVLLGPNDRPVNVYNLGPVRAAALRADPDVRIEGETPPESAQKPKKKEGGNGTK